MRKGTTLVYVISSSFNCWENHSLQGDVIWPNLEDVSMMLTGPVLMYVPFEWNPLSQEIILAFLLLLQRNLLDSCAHGHTRHQGKPWSIYIGILWLSVHLISELINELLRFSAAHTPPKYYLTQRGKHINLDIHVSIHVTHVSPLGQRRTLCSSPLGIVLSL